MTGTTVLTAAGSTGPTVGPDDVVAGRCSPEDVCRFLTDLVPVTVATALAPLLPDGAGPFRAVVTRAKLKPGRKLTVSVDLSGEGIGERPAVVTWGPASAPPVVPDALQSRVSPALCAPFSASVLSSGPAGMTVLLAPVDPAFPQLVDAYDPVRIASVVTDAGVRGFEGGLRVTALRYRPGQRHVLLVESSDRKRRLFAKCYRDDSGRRAIEASHAVAKALWATAATAAPAGTVPPAWYSQSHRLVLWADQGGVRLSHAVCAESLRADERLAHVRRAGAALRAIHEGAVDEGAARQGDVLGKARSGPAAEAAATRRAVEHVTVFAPSAGARLDALLVDTLAGLDGLAAESGHLVHGDFKGDNLLVDGDRLVLLDFDRVSVGDPAADLGTLVADLHWWAQVARQSPAALVDAVLDGYGPCPPGRIARALHYGVIYQLRAVGRRIPLHQRGWAEAVEAHLETAQAAARAAARETGRVPRGRVR
jgi:aminoglycoside phosphotransferase (APT) family kinase protein